MRLIINCVLLTAEFHLLNKELKLVSSKYPKIAGSEYAVLLEELEKFLVEAGWSFADITHIYCITGPAPFTGGRIVTLTLGSVAKIYPVKLVGLTLFEYWSILGNRYPMACSANATEYILASSVQSQLELLPIAGLDLASLQTWNLERSNLQEGQSQLHCSEMSPQIELSALTKFPETRTLDPLYLKKPNITLSR
jgi:tRNA A37 threonylcarbamoyladenosine modification protein TsaB